MSGNRIVTSVMLGALLWVSSGAASAGDEEVKRYVRFTADGKTSYGLVEGDTVHELEGTFADWSRTGKTHSLDDVKLLAPTKPTKVLSTAGNYRSHLGDASPPEHPELFLKVPSALVRPGGAIEIPTNAQEVHYEAELVVVIGRRAEDVSVEEASDYILGVTCGNDVSERVWQKEDVQWWRAKGSDTFAPCGPMIVSGLNYDDLLLQLRHNGEVKQEERTSDLIFSVDKLVSFASQHMTLQPGDLLFTGTPGETKPIHPGDVVEVELEGVGVLRNKVVAEKSEDGG